MGTALNVSLFMKLYDSNSHFYGTVVLSNSVRESEIRAAAATEFHRRFHISVDETEGQGNQVNFSFLFRF